MVHDGEISDNLDSWRIHRHQHHALLMIGIGVGIGFSHHDQQLAVGVCRIGDPPFAAIDYVIIAVAFDSGLNIGGIGRSSIGFGHGKGGPDFTIQQGRQPFVILFSGGKHVQELHVACVRRAAVKCLGRPANAPHDLRKWCVFKIGQGCPGFFRLESRQEEIPQALLAGRRLELLHKRDRINPCMDFPPPILDFRDDMGIHKVLNLAAQTLDLIGVGKLHST